MQVSPLRCASVEMKIWGEGENPGPRIRTWGTQLCEAVGYGERQAGGG
jgi:hypothetical protein